MNATRSRRSRGMISRQFVHEAETPEQQLRRSRKHNVLKTEFRVAAARSAMRVFGRFSPQVDIVDEKSNCTERIVEGLAKQSTPDRFQKMLENFLNTVKLKDGELRKGSLLANMICDCSPAIKEKAVVSVVELLMATEDEMLTCKFMESIQKADVNAVAMVLEGINKMAAIDYIHTMGACAEGFVKNPEKSAGFIGKIARSIGGRPSSPGSQEDLLFADHVLVEVVREQLGLND